MALANASSTTAPTTGSDSFITSPPEEYIIEMHEIGICKTNPITGDSGSETWNKTNNVVLWTKGNGKAITVDVAPGKKMSSDLILKQPPLDSYNYNYVVIKKTIKIKAKAEFTNATLYSGVNSSDEPISVSNIDDYKRCNNEINTINNNFYYKKDNIECLLLKVDKATTSTAGTETQYILTVYDCTSGPIVVRQNSGIDIGFSTTSGVIISSGEFDDPKQWNSGKSFFQALPPTYVPTLK
mgnify:CR=1 FL=1